MLQRVLRYAASQGADVAALLDEVGLTAEAAADPERLHNLTLGVGLHVAAAAALRDPALGLSLAQSSAPRDYGIIGLLFQHSDTVLDAFRTLGSVYGQLLASAWLNIVEVGDEVRVQHGFRGDLPGLDFVRQDALAAFFLQSRRAAGGSWSPLSVSFSQVPADPAPYRALFGVEVGFGAAEDEMVLRRDWLTAPSPTADPLLLAHLRGAAEVHLARRRAAAGQHVAMVRLRGCMVDISGGVVHRGKEVLHLTSRERELLEALARRPNQVVTHEELERDVWRIGRTVVTHAPAVAVRRLRQKIEPADAGRPVNLLTVFGEGWKLVVQDDAGAEG
jgi:hypothetical protein